MAGSTDLARQADATFRAAFALEECGADRRVEMSVSSECPVRRESHLEILGHRPGEVDLSRVEAGVVPLLVDHRAELDRQVGRVERAWLEGGKLRARVRLSDTEAGREAHARIRAGEVKAVSVGYRIEQVARIGERDGLPILRATRWTPHEVSLVAVPADPSVGIGRSAPKTERNRMTKPDATAPAKPDSGDPAAYTAERQRIKDILALGKIGEIDRRDVDAAIESGVSADAFRRRVFEIQSERDAAKPELCATVPTTFGGRRDHQRVVETFSLARAIAAQISGDWSEAGLEREVHQELRQTERRSTDGFLVPAWAVTASATGRRDLLTSNNADSLLGVDHLGEMFVESLKPASLVIGLGASVLPGNRHDISIPKVTAGTATEWIAEDGAATESTPTFTNVTASYHHVSTRFSFTRRMAVQGDPALEEILTADARRELALAIDRAAISGSGLGAEPRGILATPGVGSVIFGENGAAPSWAKVLEFISSVEAADAGGGMMGFAINSKTKAALMATSRDAGSGSFILDGDGSRMAGYSVGVSNIVPSDGTKGTGTGLSSMVFGNWSDLYLVQFGATEVVVDPYSQFEKGNVRVTLHSHWDIALRHPEAFAVATDVIA